MKETMYLINCIFDLFKRNIFIIIVTQFCFGVGHFGLADNVGIKASFDEKYEAWYHRVRLDYLIKPQEQKDKLVISVDDIPSSCPSYYMDNDEFKAIVKIGPKILQLIVEKIEKGHPVEKAYMHSAFLLITKVRLNERDYPPFKPDECYNDVIIWWKQNRVQTDLRFEKLYDRKRIDPNDSENNKLIYDLGIAAIPLAIKKIQEGDADLIEAVNYWTDDALKKSAEEKGIAADGMRDYCIKWWEENKENWLLPRGEEKEKQ